MRTDRPALGVELYAHTGDDGDIDWAGENVNVAARPENAAVVAELRGRLLAYIRLP